MHFKIFVFVFSKYDNCTWCSQIILCTLPFNNLFYMIPQLRFIVKCFSINFIQCVIFIGDMFTDWTSKFLL